MKERFLQKFCSNYANLICQIAIPKAGYVSGTFYKNVVLKSLQTNAETCPDTSPQVINCCEFLHSYKMNVIAHTPYSPDLALFKLRSISLVGDTGLQAKEGLQFISLILVY